MKDSVSYVFFVVVVVAVVVPNYFEPASKKGKRRDLRAVGICFIQPLE